MTVLPHALLILASLGWSPALRAQQSPNQQPTQPCPPGNLECQGARALGSGDANLKSRAGNIGGVQQYRAAPGMVRPGGQVPSAAPGMVTKPPPV